MTTDAIQLMQFESAKKTPGLPYLFLIFFWWFGAHAFYLGRTIKGIFWLCASILGIVLFVASIASASSGVAADIEHAGTLGTMLILLWLVVGIAWIVDACLIPRWVRQYNNKLMQTVVKDSPAS